MLDHFQLAGHVALRAEQRRDKPVTVEEVATVIAVRGIRRNQRLAKRRCLAMTFERARQVSQMSDRWRVLDSAEFFIRRRQLTLESAIAGRVLRETVEIFQTSLNDQRTSRSRARQVRDCIVYFEDDRIRELPHFVEAPFGSRPLFARDARLPRRRYDSNQQREHNESPPP
jgi:hypothetical protein